MMGAWRRRGRGGILGLFGSYFGDWYLSVSTLIASSSSCPGVYPPLPSRMGGFPLGFYNWLRSEIERFCLEFNPPGLSRPENLFPPRRLRRQCTSSTVLALLGNRNQVYPPDFWLKVNIVEGYLNG